MDYYNNLNKEKFIEFKSKCCHSFATCDISINNIDLWQLSDKDKQELYDFITDEDKISTEQYLIS